MADPGEVKGPGLFQLPKEFGWANKRRGLCPRGVGGRGAYKWNKKNTKHHISTSKPVSISSCSNSFDSKAVCGVSLRQGNRGRPLPLGASYLIGCSNNR